MTRRISARAWDALTSLKLTLICLAMLMILVVACTLAQVELGTFGAVNVYIRSFFIWWHLPGTAVKVPVFPGGGLVGLVLTLNLVAAQVKRLELSWRKSGLWIVHAGLILLFVGEFVTGAFQVETQLSIEEGRTVGYVESPRQVELAVADVTDPGQDDVYGIPESLLASSGVIAVPGTPLKIRVKAFFQNAELTPREPGEGGSPVDQGLGTRVRVGRLAPVSGDNEIDLRAAYVEPVADGRSYGTWLVSNALEQPQSFVHQGRTWTLSLRPRREYLPYSLTLKRFSHDKYAGTEIPKNFSSLIQLDSPAR